ncbi:MAG: 2-C-methyl-D-erythritol 4-phosphate cytidylyltransferase, partial [Candidatus Eremiobacteraeota bacterium]|nr:2-C-methyl-D-erythritol 4-phosphate cytidylyltransferase [Candidatus Eremiobacteraeota bacterium]
MSYQWAALIVAAGRGTRLGQPKQFLELAGMPMVGWSIETFARMPEIADVVVVTEPESIEPMRELVERLAPQHTVRVVEGGASRQESVRKGLRVVPERCEAVLVHDGARPLVRVEDVRAGMMEVRDGRGALLAVPVVDTVKLVRPHSKVVEKTLDRATLWSAQTPQFALTADLLWAHERAREEEVDATDDASLLERIGVEV